MSLYNIMHGANPATFIILPMLGKHPADYPRFRDCWIGRVKNDHNDLDGFNIPIKKQDISKKIISVYTRVGGNNRENYVKEIETLRNMPGYIKDFDDDFDTTFATFEFKVPKKWMKDFDLILNNNMHKVSKEYQTKMKRIFPKLKKEFTNLFKKQ